LIILLTGYKDRQNASVAAGCTISEKRTNRTMAGTTPGQGSTPAQQRLVGWVSRP
jgi:hypothetical protein